MSFAIRTGCVLTYKRCVFRLKAGRSHMSRRAKTSPYEMIGEQVVKARVLRHSYGSLREQHTFTLEVIETVSTTSEHDVRQPGDTILVKGRNLYPNLIEHVQGDESKRCSALRKAQKKFLWGIK